MNSSNSALIVGILISILVHISFLTYVKCEFPLPLPDSKPYLRFLGAFLTKHEIAKLTKSHSQGKSFSPNIPSDIPLRLQSNNREQLKFMSTSKPNTFSLIEKSQKTSIKNSFLVKNSSRLPDRKKLLKSLGIDASPFPHKPLILKPQ